MMKFFRKHNKTLLAVFMVLLMVVFVGGSALQSLLQPHSNVLIGQSRFGPIKTLDGVRAQNSTKILEGLGINWSLLGGGRPPLQQIDWVLLTREAETLDAAPDKAAIESWLAGQINRTQLNRVAQVLGVKVAQIRAAIGEFLSVQTAQKALIGAGIPSETEVRSWARRVLDRVSVHAVTLPASAFVNDDLQFSPAEMKSHWEPLRDVEPGIGLQFGYYVPTKIQVQYLKIDPAVIEESIGIANLESKAKRLYEEERKGNPAFARPPTEAGVDDEGPKPPPYLTWEEAKETAVSMVKEKHASDAATDLAQWIVAYDADRWIEAKRGTDGYKEATDEVKAPSFYEEIVGHLPATMSYADAVTVVTTKMFTQDEAPDVPDIGTASFSAPGVAWKTFGTLAFQSQPVIPEVPKGKNVNAGDYLAVYQTCQYVLAGDHGHLFIFRVIGAEEGHPSESLEEVHDRVLADMRLLDGFEKAKAVAEGLRSCSPEIPLNEAFDSDASIASAKAKQEGVGFYEAEGVTRMTQYDVGSSVPNRGKFVRGIGFVPDDVINQWFKLEDAWERTAVYELKDRATVLVVEWQSSEPARHDEYEGKRQAIVDQLTRARQGEAIAAWFNPENVRARNEFKIGK